MRSIRPVLTLLDPAVVVVAGLLVLPGTSPRALLGAALAVAVLCRLADLNRPRLVLSVVEDLPGLVVAAATAVVSLAALDDGVHLDRAHLPEVATYAAALFAGSVLLRTAMYAGTHLLRRAGVLTRRVVVVGAGPVGRRLTDILLTRRELGLRPVGIVGSAPPGDLRGLPLSLLGGIDDLPGVMLQLRARDVLFASTAEPDAVVVTAVRRSLERAEQVFVVPRFQEAIGRDRRLRTEVVDDIAVMRLPRLGAALPIRVARRAVDVVVALCGLVVLSPVLAVIALAVRVETGPTVLFRQTRVGVGGRVYTVLRFRSLRPAALSSESTSWSIEAARRRGPVGRLLRRSGLDELPQVVDVLRGALVVDPHERRDPTERWFSDSVARPRDAGRAATALAPMPSRRG